MELSQKSLELLQKIAQKYQNDNQPLESYLEGLLHQKYVDYWDYIKVETLLSLQETKTNIPDENIFIIYHQITELYFKLIHNELDQIIENQLIEKDYLILRLNRISNYFEHLVSSFSIMKMGMEKSQFLEFRMSLLPASGFQSAQYRLIEFKTTSILNLLHIDKRIEDNSQKSIEELYPLLYWKFGAIDKSNGNKALTLLRFEEKYDDFFVEFLKNYKDKNIFQLLSIRPDLLEDSEVVVALRKFDYFSNVIWPNAHVITAARYLGKGQDAVGATGGTNWQDYLPPRHQQRKYFPMVWSPEEVANWGSPDIKI